MTSAPDELLCFFRIEYHKDNLWTISVLDIDMQPPPYFAVKYSTKTPHEPEMKPRPVRTYGDRSLSTPPGWERLQKIYPAEVLRGALMILEMYYDHQKINIEQGKA